MKNLPNLLTVSRIIGSVPLFFLILCAPYYHWVKLTTIVVLAGLVLTDFLDGKIARRYNLVTPQGEFLDPLADKLLVCAVYIPLIHVLATAWLPLLTFIMIIRDTSVTALRAVVVGSGQRLPARPSGKFRTCGSFALGLFLIFRIKVNAAAAPWWVTDWSLHMPESILAICIVLQVILTLYSLYDYFGAQVPFLRRFILTTPAPTS